MLVFFLTFVFVLWGVVGGGDLRLVGGARAESRPVVVCRRVVSAVAEGLVVLRGREHICGGGVRVCAGG